MAGVVRWTLLDPVTSELFVFPINPSAGGTPSLMKNLSAKSACAVNGQTIIFEGRRQVIETEFSGHILQQSDYTSLKYWANKTNQVYLTDDLGNSYTVYISSVTFTRVRSAIYPWKHTYVCKYMILDWV